MPKVAGAGPGSQGFRLGSGMAGAELRFPEVWVWGGRSRAAGSECWGLGWPELGCGSRGFGVAEAGRWLRAGPRPSSGRPGAAAAPDCPGAALGLGQPRGPVERSRGNPSPLPAARLAHGVPSCSPGVPRGECPGPGSADGISPLAGGSGNGGSGVCCQPLAGHREGRHLELCGWCVVSRGWEGALRARAACPELPYVGCGR